MPNPIELKPLAGAELLKTVGKVKTLSATHPKAVKSPADLKSARLRWLKGVPAPPSPPVQLKKIKALRLRANDVAKLRAINESATPTAEAVVKQKVGPDQILGLLYSSLATLEYTKLQAEFKKRSGSATSPGARLRVRSEWSRVLKAAQQAFAAGGLKGVTETDLGRFSRELSKSKANFNTVVNIANTAVPVGPRSGGVLRGGTVAAGGWIADIGVLLDPGIIVVPIPGLCDKPFAQGTFTKHFGRSFSLTVRLTYWCPTWTNPFRTCTGNFTIAGVSFSVDVQVGYRVTCCGAIVWGQASAQACGTIIGVSVCAGCTATITGVAGIGRAGSGSNCTYGIGVNANLVCKFAGLTVFQAQAPFGFDVTGPCPPAGLCP